MNSAIPLISVENITKRFPGVTALDGVTFDVRAGEFHSVVGENGAGKSTLMKILSGVITDYDGTLRIAGRGRRLHEHAQGRSRRDFDHPPGTEPRGGPLGGGERFSRPRKADRLCGLLDDRAMQRAAAALFGELECQIRPEQPVRTLRVGDQQLVEIAKALSQDASILIMDEPTSALTESEVERLFRIIDRLLARGVTIVYISHKLDEVFRRSDRITVLRDGRHVKTLDRSATNPREITHLMVGREIENINLAENRSPGEVVLEVAGLSLPWTGHARAWRLRDINFALRRGEVLGVAGLMGAGRTELMECLFGTSPEPPAWADRA